MDMTKTVKRAIELLDPPTQAELARVCGQRPQAVTRWIKTGRIPAHHVIAIEQATNAGVTRYELRPDVFGAPARAKAAA